MGGVVIVGAEKLRASFGNNGERGDGDGDGNGAGLAWSQSAQGSDSCRASLGRQCRGMSSAGIYRERTQGFSRRACRYLRNHY